MLLKKDLTTSFPCAISLLPLSLQNTALQARQKWSVQPTTLSMVSHHSQDVDPKWFRLQSLGSPQCPWAGSSHSGMWCLVLIPPNSLLLGEVIVLIEGPWPGGPACELCCYGISPPPFQIFPTLPSSPRPGKSIAIVTVPGLRVAMVEPTHDPGHGKVNTMAKPVRLLLPLHVHCSLFTPTSPPDPLSLFCAPGGWHLWTTSFQALLLAYVWSGPAWGGHFQGIRRKRVRLGISPCLSLLQNNSLAIVSASMTRVSSRWPILHGSSSHWSWVYYLFPYRLDHCGWGGNDFLSLICSIVVPLTLKWPFFKVSSFEPSGTNFISCRGPDWHRSPLPFPKRTALSLANRILGSVSEPHCPNFFHYFFIIIKV